MPRRGEIWWVRLDPTLGSEIAKTRPCLVLSTNIVNDRRRAVVVIPLSTSPRPSPPILVSVHHAGHDVVAVIDQIRAIAKERLLKHISDISPEDLQAVETAVRQILELA